jgi:hypothetical protein
MIPVPTADSVPTPILDALTDFRGFQTFFSIYERIAPEVGTHSRINNCWLGLPATSYKSLERDETNPFSATLHLSNGKQAPIFIKRAHILDPLDCIEGECVWPVDGSMPAPSELWMNALEKINDPLNEAYVDALFATLADRMVVQGISPHWMRCYGTCIARVNKYRYDITEEYPSLRGKSFWDRHQKLGLFGLHVEEPATDDVGGNGCALLVDDTAEELDLGDFESVETTNTPARSVAVPVAEEGAHTIAVADDSIDGATASVVLSEPAVRISKLEGVGSAASSETSGGRSSSDENDFNDYYAEFTDFPVQVSLLERAEGTIDELIDKEGALNDVSEQRWTAWMFQVIAGLAAAQHWFGFVHNDLHTNNILWSRTDIPYIYYKVHKSNVPAGVKQTAVYRVPTYGYIMKIIDFGRASFTLPEPYGFFISDAFYPGNDAAFQYNCEPFYDQKAGKKVEPNPSFDLCRLAVGMLESLFPKRPANNTPIKIVGREGGKTYAETVSPLYNLMWEWLTDDEGKNVLREPDGKERYPDFDLYPAISIGVHSAVPAAQIEKPIFHKAFNHTGKIEGGAPVYELWAK